MEVRKVPIDQIIPAAYNPRKDLQPGDEEYEQIRRSIDRFGFVEPLVWNQRTGNLIGGHQRLKLLVAEGAEEVEVSVVDLDETEERALNIALNKVEGEWDSELLALLLQDIARMGVDPTITGFDEKDLEGLLKFSHEIGDDPLALDEEEDGGSSREPKKVVCPHCGYEFPAN